MGSQERNSGRNSIAGKGLLSPFYPILGLSPGTINLHHNVSLVTAIKDCRTFIRESISSPTKCRNLVAEWPDFIGITDALGHGLGGVIVGKNMPVTPTVLRLQWPEDVSRNIVSATNTNGTITNSALEMARLHMLWLIMEEICQPLAHSHVALFSDNSPTVHWVQPLALRIHLKRVSPLTTMH